MKATKTFILTMAIAITACKGGSGGGGGDSSSGIVDTSFSDVTVSNFQQLTGVAQLKPKWHEYLISPAYAGGGDIRCVSGESISISMDVVLGADTNNLLIDSTCGSSVVLDIRRKMLESLDGHKLMRELSGAGEGIDYVLDFTSGFEYGVPYTVFETEKTVAAVTRDCFLDYTFNISTGSLSMDTVNSSAQKARDRNRAANNAMGVTNPHDGSVGCYAQPDTFASVNFRFKDGKIELDQSSSGNFSPNGCALWVGDSISDYKENGLGDGTCPDAGYDSTYERWCVDDNTDGTCDSI